MHADKRRALATYANQIADFSRYGGAPRLDLASDAETIGAWLQWCDPDGCHTADLARREGAEPYDLDRAWEALDAMTDD